MFAKQCIHTPFTVGGEIPVFQVVSGVVVFEYREEEAGGVVHMHLIWGQPGGGADRIVVRKFHVLQMDVPAVMSVVADHRQHLSHYVVDSLDATVAAGVVGIRLNFPHAEDLIHGK